MEAAETRFKSDAYDVRPWEFNVLLIEVVLLAGLAVGWVFALGPRLLDVGSQWADATWKGIGFFLLGLALYPVLRIHARHVRGHELSFGRWILGALLGSAVGALVYLLIR